MIEERRDNLLDIVDDDRLDEVGGVHEARIRHVADQFQHRIPETADIGKHQRLAVTPELGPGHDLDDLFERADPAGQRDESVGPLEHLVLADVHVRCHDQFAELAQRMPGGFLVHEEFGYNARDPAATGKNTAGNRAHDALRTPAIDEAQMVFGDRASKGAAGLDVGRVASRL